MIDKRWVVFIVFTSVIVVAAIVVPVVIVMRGRQPETSGVNDPYLTGGQGAGFSDQGQMVAEGAEPGMGIGDVGAAVAPAGDAPPNGAAMAPSEMVVQFGGMIDCLLKRGSLAYNGYGCYCGLGGGGKPLDATDRCCKTHDECYSRLKRQGICKGDKSVYLSWYKVNMNQCDTPNAKIWCANHHQYSYFDSLLAGRQARCAAHLCHCDRNAALCFARHSHTYNLNYAAYQGKTNC